jgi:ABC-type transport system substrate-binding protein
MKETKKWVVSFARILLLVFLIVSFQNVVTAAADKPITAKEWAAKLGYDWGPKYWPSQPVRGGILQIASPQYIGLMNPNHWPVNDWVTMGLIYDKLVHTDARYAGTVPWLAESWKFPDDLTCIMTLRQGVQFHDGSSFNAESVKYQMEWIMDPANGAWSRSWLENLASVEVMDTYKLKWNFKKPWPGFIGLMASAPGFMISMKALKADVALRDLKKQARQVDSEKRKVEQAEKEAAGASGEAAEAAKAKIDKTRKELAAAEEQYKKMATLAEGAKELDSNPVGAGAYILEEANPGNYLKLKRNPNYWLAKFLGKDMPYFDGMKISVIPDPSVRLANLRAGKLDNMVIDASQYTIIKNDRSLHIYVFPQNHYVGLRFNTQEGACKDIRVRKAISYAIDRKALINGVSFGLGRPAASMYPDDHWCHNPTLKPVKYDPALSKKLLAEAGYKSGLTVKGFMLNTTDSQTLAEAVKAMLAKVGIEWKVELLDGAAISEKMRKRNYELAGGGYAWIFEPDQMPAALYLPDGAFNYGRSNNPRAIALIEQAHKEMNQAKRTKLYQELDKVVYDNYEEAFLWYPTWVVIFRKDIQGWNHPMYLKFRDGHYFSHPWWFKNGHR